jgi:hypothetical protein
VEHVRLRAGGQGFSQARSLPLGEILDGIAAHAELEKVQWHR